MKYIPRELLESEIESLKKEVLYLKQQNKLLLQEWKETINLLGNGKNNSNTSKKASD
jgi:hypothetical protein